MPHLDSSDSKSSKELVEVTIDVEELKHGLVDVIEELLRKSLATVLVVGRTVEVVVVADEDNDDDISDSRVVVALLWFAVVPVMLRVVLLFWFVVVVVDVVDVDDEFETKSVSSIPSPVPLMISTDGTSTFLTLTLYFAALIRTVTALLIACRFDDPSFVATSELVTEILAGASPPTSMEYVSAMLASKRRKAVSRRD